MSFHFVDAFHPSKDWYHGSDTFLTIDGSQLTEEGYRKFSGLLVDQIFGNVAPTAKINRDLIHAAVLEKNWMWHNDFKMPNGVHVHGRRYNPYGPENYPAEIVKIREMTANRDEAIWQASKGEKMDLAEADKKMFQCDRSK